MLVFALFAARRAARADGRAVHRQPRVIAVVVLFIGVMTYAIRASTGRCSISAMCQLRETMGLAIGLVSDDRLFAG